nr:acyltransferase [Propionibacterium sp.]
MRDFVAARIARIYPLYLAALAFAALPTLGRLPWWTGLHVLALQTWSPALDVAFGLNGPGWSIGVEFFLYALFPLLLWAVLRIPRRAWLWVGVGAVILLTLVTGSLYLARTNLLPWADPASAHRWLYRTPLTRIPDFTVGIVIALIVKNSGSQRWASAVQWLSAAALVALMSSDRMLFSIISWDIGYLIPSAALIWSLAAAPHAPLARLLSARPLVHGGTISYAFYLFHQPLIHALQASFGGGDGRMGGRRGHDVVHRAWCRVRRAPRDRGPSAEVAAAAIVNSSGRHHRPAPGQGLIRDYV